MHPEVFLPEQKEPEFFARDEIYNYGIESYARAFSQARENQTVGEASTIYTLSPFFPETAQRIRNHIPKAKLIYIMREPVKRAYSYYLQIVKNYQNATGDYSVHRSFEDFVFPERHSKSAPRSMAIAPFDSHLPDDPELCLAGSDYVYQIRRYLEYFPRDHFLFLKYEDFICDEMRSLKKITDFLNLPNIPNSNPSRESRVRNKSSEHFLNAQKINSMKSLATRYPFLLQAQKLLPPPIRNGIKNIYQSSMYMHAHGAPRDIEIQTKQTLSTRFLNDLNELEDITGLDLQDWKASQDK